VELASQTATAERYAREWLEQQTVAKIIEVDDEKADARKRRFSLPAAYVEVLVDQDSLNYLAPLARLVDPLPVVRDHVYHPDFGGSFSLKSILPALVPALGYDDLEIAEGETASRVLMQLVADDPTLLPAERATKREALLRYCERDTLAMVRVLSRLRELAQRT